MKTIVATGLVALFFIAVVAGWKAYHPSVLPASASVSQIFIHGTPVCVFRQGDSIAARIGECESGIESPGEAPGGRIPDEDATGLGLPPGHPPVGPDMLPDGGDRRVLI